MLNLLYIRFPNSFDGGVKSYSTMMIKILSAYAKNEIIIFDLSAYLEKYHPHLDISSIKDMKPIFESPGIVDILQNVDLALTDVGLMEHRELIFIDELKKRHPKIKTVITLHDPPLGPINLVPFFENYQDLLITKVIRKIYNLLIGNSQAKKKIRSADGIITLSIRGLEITKSNLFLGYEKNTKQFAFHHPNIIETDLNKKSPKDSESSITIGYYGFISKAKGLHILLEALRMLVRDDSNVESKLRILIAGRPNTKSDLSYYNTLIKYVKKYEMGQNVYFLGYLTDQDTTSFFESIDLLVLPYRTTGSMSASGPLMLARSFGTPVLASDTPIFVDYINNGEDGLIFSNCDGSDGLFRKIVDFIDNNELRLRLQNGSSRRATESSWRKSAYNFIKILKQI